ncbi:MAG: FAD-dependent oxidoreductase [Myxococcota bacterium]|nr:FAD-dependent oxidoreductase [Myxococcota bacterium]
MSGRRRRVVILGGGFAGLVAAQTLRPDRHRVTLVDRRPWFEFLPNIHELLSGVKSPELLRLRLDQLVRRGGHAFVRDEVTAIDPETGTVSLSRRRPLHYDALIVCLGGVESTRGVPGVEAHALGFKSVEQCARIGRELDRLAGGRGPMRVSIVGGGLEGVEALGEILRRHRRRPELRVTVIEAQERLLPEAPARLDRYVRRLCAPYPVEFACGSPVRRVAEAAVELEDGRSLASDLTIWTGGPGPPTLLAAAGLAAPGAWASVRPTLQAERYPAVFIAGDAARGPEPISKQAYHAIDMGRCAARNAERFLAGRELAPFRPSGKPMLISFGDLSCFLVAGERVLASPALAAAKEGVFELVMAQLDAAQGCGLFSIARRAERAGRELLWPSISSPAALRRQARFAFL